MKQFEFRVELEGTIVIEAPDENTAREMVEDGAYDINNIDFTEVEEDFLGEVKLAEEK